MASKAKTNGQNKRKLEGNNMKPVAPKRKRVMTRKLRDSSSDKVEIPPCTEPATPKPKRGTRTQAVKKNTIKNIVVAKADNIQQQKKETKKKTIKTTVKKPKIVKKKIVNKPIKYERIAPLESINEVALMQSAKKNAKKYLFNKKALLERIEETEKRVIKIKLPKNKAKKKKNTNPKNTIGEIIENNLEQDVHDPEDFVIIKVPAFENVGKRKSATKTSRETPTKVQKITKNKKSTTKIKRVSAKNKVNKIKNTPIKKARPKKVENEDIEPKGTNDISGKISSFEQKYISRLSLSSVSCRNSELSDALSWTKEMSSTSKSCSPVSVKDIVKIDGKIPLVTVLKDEMLPIVNKNITSPSYSDIIQNKSLNLSSATSSTCLNSFTSDSSYSLFTSLGLTKSNDDNKSIDKKLEENLELIKSKVNSFDVEFVTWSMRDYEDKPIQKDKLADIIVKALKHELDLLEKCKQMRPLINLYNKKQDKKDSSIQSSEMVSEETIQDQPIETVIPTVEKDITDEFAKPSPVITHRKTSITVENVINPTVVRTDQTDINDDDCLSIYDSADSFWINNMSDNVQKQSDFELISDMELSDSGSEFSACENEPKNNVENKQVYQIQNDQIPIICEKQNADTTFTDDRTAITNTTVEKQNDAITSKDTSDINTSTDPIRLLTPNYAPISIVKSAVFSGLCIFNLMGTCKNFTNCRFNHRRPNPEQIISKLEKIGDFSFVQEYVLMRDKNGLMAYFPIFVKDCLRRQLWDLLAEMAIDIYNSPSILDVTLRMSVLEQILLGFNGCDLNTVKVLDYSLHEDYLLCHMFLRMIAHSSNFTQFKEVFIKLGDHFESKKHSVSLNIAIPIVERVCLIAYNKNVVEATLKIILNTEKSILNTQYMDTFGNLLNCSLLDSSLANKWKQFKQGFFEDNTATPNTVENIDAPRYTSPDTTHLENANKQESILCAKMDTFNPFNIAPQNANVNPFEVFNKPNAPQASSFKRNFAFSSESKPLGRWNSLKRQRHRNEDTKNPWQRRNFKTINRTTNNKLSNFSPHGPPNYFKP